MQMTAAPTTKTQKRLAGWVQGVSSHWARTHGGSSVRHASWPWLL
ncbi:hypothetical protein MICRO11B_80045 [Micrococcus luteus]|nr:hypothetical protein MICRO11B_80045 [Micrococcus luteus]